MTSRRVFLSSTAAALAASPDRVKAVVRIASCHAKDLELLSESNIHLQEVIPGRGHVDYRAYLRGLSELRSDIPLILEHLKTPQEYEEGAAHIRRVAHEVGIEI